MEGIPCCSRALRRIGLLAATIISAAAYAATPAWVWLDEHGQRVYSDRPPPPSVPRERILRAPGENTALPKVEAADAPAAAPAPSAAPQAAEPPAAKDEQASQERAALEKRKAEIRADNCKRARAALQMLEANKRLVTVDEQGRRVTMTTQMKEAERERLQTIVRENCP
jgi:pyruvate/2-oxoglutarate dehydrogenase complex dihydrolipoamide acyltransferase (E2) component